MQGKIATAGSRPAFGGQEVPVTAEAEQDIETAPAGPGGAGGRARAVSRRAVRRSLAQQRAELGRDAQRPTQIPWRGWRSVLHRTVKEMISDRVSLVSAGCAFYATLALFPAISMLVSTYGLMFDPVSVEPQLHVLSRLLPPEGFKLIADRVHLLVSQPTHKLGLGLLISTMLTFWSAATGTKAIISGLNVAYEEVEQRSFLRFQLTAFLMTLGVIVAAVVGLALLVGLPAIFAFVGLSAYAKNLIGVISWLLLMGFVVFALSLLYRFGPCRRRAKWHWVTPGSLLAACLWLIGSALFSLYVGRIATYDATYGPLGAVVGVMMWFWVTVLAVLLGAELNAELELQTAEDSTEGTPKPMGKRGAFVADHVADD
ncbi:MAG: YihY/virulence factor BrkB family protein [Acidisphaera sp.]|nr:YihY/virulence factor BrkB family protein [Acidisphaera sp.]